MADFLRRGNSFYRESETQTPVARVEWTPDGPGLHVFAEDGDPMPRQRLYDSEDEILAAFKSLGHVVTGGR